MRLPKFSHIFTRGITANRKGMALATKGIIDKKIGGKPIPPVFETEDIIKLKARKIIDKIDCYTILGKKEIKIYKVFALMGRKTIVERNGYLVKALVVRETIDRVILKAKKLFELEETLDLSGKKIYNELEKMSLYGSKIFNESDINLIIGKKVFNVSEQKKLLGLKTIEENNIVFLKGKKNITNILEVLDLI